MLWQLGRHRLICGDAADPAVIAALMPGEQAQLLVTSPPYANQRAYTTGGIADWEALLRGVFAAAMAVMAPAGQMLVNLGLVHRDGTVLRYWDDWLAWMPQQGWRFFGWYVWDQSVTVPGDWAGRLAPRHEFLFHFNRQARKPNKIVPCKFAGQDVHLRDDGSSSGGLRGKEGDRTAWNHVGKVTQDFRIPDSVVTVTRQRGAIGDGIDHPAVFPVALPEFVIEAYSDAGDIVFEPFAGSGTTLLAAERAGRHCRAVEIAPAYVDVAIKRFQQNFPGTPVTLASTGQTFAAVAASLAPRRPRAGGGMTAAWFADRIEQWPLAKLLPYARNARVHSDEQVAQIAASIAEFGFANPILAGERRRDCRWPRPPRRGAQARAGYRAGGGARSPDADATPGAGDHRQPPGGERFLG